MQHDLFPRSSLTLKPESGRSEPRLWARRLVIWEKPSHIIRDIELRPGLNIIWSPDSTQQSDAPIGHGSGKTTFCRFLRYCLGEDSFAPEGQRTAIWNNFPEGHVGAEVLLDGKLWIILRALSALQESIEKRRTEMQLQIKEIDKLKAMEPTLKQNIALVRQRLSPLEKTVAALENAILQRSDAVRKAERLVDDITRYEEFLTEKDKLGSAIEIAETQLEKTKETLTAHRTAVSEVISNLSRRFDTILRELIHADIQGEIKLDGKGLNLKVELGGERSTAAIDSLKVVAFDLSVLTLTIEGKTHLPAFLLHDSPREADLGASIYGHLFDVAKRLENTGASPLFQYIVTTTTEPPDDCRAEPWLRLTINGSPAAHRLLKNDL